MDIGTGARLGALAAIVWGIAAASVASAAEPNVIVLTQTACQFVESEDGVDHGFISRKKADCVAINAETGEERLAKAEVLTLEPGDYIFKVTNTDVDYEVGFWVRDDDYDPGNPLHKLMKTSVSGGGLFAGDTQEYEVTLEPGEYLYSCPLNTTPDYRLVVSAN